MNAMNAMNDSFEQEYEALVQFMYLAPVGLLQARRNGEILMINPRCAQWLMPLSQDGCLDNLYTALAGLVPDLSERVDACTSAQGMVCEGLALCLTPTPGDRRHARHLTLSLMKLDEDRVMAVLNDVTLAVQRERELRQSRAWLQTLVTNLADYALMTLDEHGCLAEWNASVERVTGHGREGSLGRRFDTFFAPEATKPERQAERLQEAERNGWSLEEGWLLRADGSRYWGASLIAPLHAQGEPQLEDRAYSLLLRDGADRDGTDREGAGTALKRAQDTDTLTGLPERRALIDATTREVLRLREVPRPLSMVMVDTDHFRLLQERHGAADGNAVVRHLAAGLSASFRAQDLVARVGDSRFAVLLPGASVDSAEAVAMRVCHHMAAQPVPVSGQGLRCTISVGVAHMTAGAENAEGVQAAEALVGRAEQALQLAQAQGGNRVRRWQPGLQGARAPPAPPAL